jgi:hypothetical protein
MFNVVETLMHRASQIDRPVDAFEFCRIAAELMNTEIEVTASRQIPFRLPAFILRLEGKGFCILYRPSDCFISVQKSILHELAHALLGHRRLKPTDLISGYSLYTDSEQREAEMFAKWMVMFIVQKPMNESARIAARFEQPMSKKQTPGAASEANESQVSQRFRALMSPERRRRRLSR